MHHTEKYSQYSSIIWPVWLNGWEFVCELSDCGYELCCCYKSYFYFEAVIGEILAGKKNLYFAFVDSGKSWKFRDQVVPRDIVYWALRKLGVEECLVKTV